jgi:hypothetical protein
LGLLDLSFFFSIINVRISISIIKHPALQVDVYTCPPTHGGLVSPIRSAHHHHHHHHHHRDPHHQHHHPRHHHHPNDHYDDYPYLHKKTLCAVSTIGDGGIRQYTSGAAISIRLS